MEKLETIPPWQLEKVKSKKEVILETQRQKESSLCYFDGHMPLQKRGVRIQITDVQRQSRVP